jgi:hypothetical protein
MQHRLPRIYPLNLDRASDEIFPKIICATVFVISLFVMSIGVSGIIEHKSPENLSSLLTLSAGFIAYFKYHALIILGGLCLTISVWLIRKNSQ